MESLISTNQLREGNRVSVDEEWYVVQGFASTGEPEAGNYGTTVELVHETTGKMWALEVPGDGLAEPIWETSGS